MKNHKHSNKIQTWKKHEHDKKGRQLKKASEHQQNNQNGGETKKRTYMKKIQQNNEQKNKSQKTGNALQHFFWVNEALPPPKTFQTYFELEPQGSSFN